MSTFVCLVLRAFRRSAISTVRVMSRFLCFSTFDGTAIASATVKHLVQRCQCLTLFATHYHSLLDEWEHAPNVRLGHMKCMVEENKKDAGNGNITFLYTLGAGACPKVGFIMYSDVSELVSRLLHNSF